MTDSSMAPDAAPLTDPGPPPPRPHASSGGDRFFAWLRGLDLPRGDGWIGGVCAGIATRIGIDPLIVRGIVVVAALFGLPLFVVYAVAWALLPDLAGQIHFQELMRRRFDPAMVGIGVMLLVGFFPVVPWFFTGVLPFAYLLPGGWSSGSSAGFFSSLVAVAIIGGIIFLIARSSSRRAPHSGGASASDPRTAYADLHAPGSPASDYSGVDAAADPAGGASAPAGSAPPPLPPGANADEVAAWRLQHDAWRVQDDAWRRQQQDAERFARDRARAERAEANAVFAAEAAERRRVRRASRPRTSGAYVALVTGAALVLGAGFALLITATQSVEPALAVAAGLLTAALIVALSMIVAGIGRRRSGFLAFVTVALLIAGSATAVAPLLRGIVFGYAYVNNLSPQNFTQVFGDLTIDVVGITDSSEPIVIEKRAGDTSIYVSSGAVVNLQVTGAESVEWSTHAEDGEVIDSGTWTGDYVSRRIDSRPSDADTVPAQIVRLDQESGTVSVSIYEP